MEDNVAANWVAYVALLGWPLIAVVLYRVRPFAEATVWTILGALLLLPAQAYIKWPMVPGIDKNSVAGLAAVVGCVLLAPRSRRPNAGFGLAGILAAAYVTTPVITSALNGDTILIGSRVLLGVGMYDGISALIGQAIAFSPFFIGRRFLSRSEDMETILRVLAVAGLFYSLLMLVEVRLSPQLSTWVYGYTPPFATEYRYGGYRPVVFMTNGLIAAFFLCTSVLAAVVLYRLRAAIVKLPAGLAASWLGAVLILCKSAGALIYAIVGGVILRWLKPIVQVRIAIFLVSIAISYPILRAADYFPDKQLVEFAATFNQERADSLKFRFDQEEQLLARASQRFLFGWGRYGRSRVYEESGQDTSVTDGLWIVTLGQFGLAGFLAQFGLIVLPVFRSITALQRVGLPREKILLASLALIVAITVVEQLPNASLSPWNWLLVGALLGRTERILSAQPQTRTPKFGRPAIGLT